MRRGMESAVHRVIGPRIKIIHLLSLSQHWLYEKNRVLNCWRSFGIIVSRRPTFYFSAKKTPNAVSAFVSTPVQDGSIKRPVRQSFRNNFKSRLIQWKRLNETVASKTRFLQITYYMLCGNSGVPYSSRVVRGCSEIRPRGNSTFECVFLSRSPEADGTN